MNFDNSSSNKVRICLIGNSKFSTMVHSLVPEYSDSAEIKIIDSTFSSAVSSARELLRSGSVDVVVSAGANAYYLKDTLSIPVVALEVKELDLINAVQKAKAIGTDILLLTFEHQLAKTNLPSHIDGVQITQKTYKTAEQARDVFLSMRHRNFSVVIGSSFVCDLAEEAGLQYVLLYSPESCREMLSKAVEIAHRIRNEDEQNAFVDFLLNQQDHPAIVVNATEHVVRFNREASHLIKGLSQGKRIDRYLDEQFIGTKEVTIEGILIEDRLTRIRKREFEINGDPVGYLYTLFQPADASQAKDTDSSLIFNSRKMEEIDKLLGLYGSTPGPVLLTGETGTGKELAAKKVHKASRNSSGPFIAINCAAIPTDLFESELFGYADGAFTGSKRGGKSGLLEAANHGTFFMDEINSLPLAQQVKLLRVLQDREIRPVGARRSVSLEIKFVAACNYDLDKEVSSGRFREDLFYRLNVFTVNLPPLRDRLEDLGPLCRHFLKQLSGQYGIAVDVDALVQKLLPEFREFSWPGNVRQLENILERLIVSTTLYESLDAFAVRLQSLVPEMYASSDKTSVKEHGNQLKNMESDAIREALDRFNGNKKLAAEFLGMSHTTLWRRVKEMEKSSDTGELRESRP